MMREEASRFRIMWLNAKNSEMKKRIRHDWFMQEYDMCHLERWWEMVVVGRL